MDTMDTINRFFGGIDNFQSIVRSNALKLYEQRLIENYRNVESLTEEIIDGRPIEDYLDRGVFMNEEVINTLSWSLYCNLDNLIPTKNIDGEKLREWYREKYSEEIGPENENGLSNDCVLRISVILCSLSELEKEYSSNGTN